MAGRDTLLEYVMPVKAIAPLPAASSAYIRKVLVLVQPLEDVETGGIVECTTKAQVEALTDSTCGILLDVGMNSIYVMPTDTLDVGDIIDATNEKFFTVLIDPAFTDVETLDLGTFAGVRGWASTDQAAAASFSIQTNSTGFYEGEDTNGENMYTAFGTLLATTMYWKNQQYIEMPKSDGIYDVNIANLMFEERISFVLTSEEYGNRLAFFVNNRKAIVAPYVYEDITLNLQSWTLQYIALNQPDYTVLEASNLQDFLQKKVNTKYVGRVVTSVKIVIEVVEDNFMLNAYITVAEPKALWRVNTTLQQGEL